MRIGGRQYLAAVKHRKSLRAQNMRRLRVSRGWLQPDMARRLGMSTTYVCQLETGFRPVSLKTVDRLAVALAMEPAQVLAELDAPIAAEVAA